MHPALVDRAGAAAVLPAGLVARLGLLRVRAGVPTTTLRPALVGAVADVLDGRALAHARQHAGAVEAVARTGVQAHADVELDRRLQLLGLGAHRARLGSILALGLADLAAGDEQADLVGVGQQPVEEIANVPVALLLWLQVRPPSDSCRQFVRRQIKRVARVTHGDCAVMVRVAHGFAAESRLDRLAGERPAAYGRRPAVCGSVSRSTKDLATDRLSGHTPTRPTRMSDPRVPTRGLTWPDEISGRRSVGRPAAEAAGPGRFGPHPGRRAEHGRAAHPGWPRQRRAAPGRRRLLRRGVGRVQAGEGPSPRTWGCTRPSRWRSCW